MTSFGPPSTSGMCAPVKKRKPKPKLPLEREVQRAIQDAFHKRHRIILWHIDAGGAGMRQGMAAGCGGHSATPAGFPDLLGFIPASGRGVLIEVKRPGGKPTESQLLFIDMLRARGCIAFWADSVDSALVQFEETQRRTA